MFALPLIRRAVAGIRVRKRVDMATYRGMLRGSLGDLGRDPARCAAADVIRLTADEGTVAALCRAAVLRAGLLAAFDPVEVCPNGGPPSIDTAEDVPATSPRLSEVLQRHGRVKI